MENDKIICPVCKKLREKDVFMREKHDMLICTECHTSLFLKGKSPLKRFKEDWIMNADNIFALLRPEIDPIDLANPRLFNLYEDCYHTLLIGRYNASIVLMGVLLEAFMKELIFLKFGEDFKKPYGPCLKKIQENKLMKSEDIQFLKRFKNETRNPYQHADESQILKGISVPVWSFEFGEDLSLEKLEKAVGGAKTGQFKPELLPVADIPAIRPIVKQTYDRIRSIYLFNQVYDFLIVANIRYFKQKEWDEHHEKFGNQLDTAKYHKLL